MTYRSARHPAVHPPEAYGFDPQTSDDQRETRAGGELSPSREDLVVRAATGVIGGPLGSRVATGRGFWRSLPVLVLLACAVLSLGLVQKQHCRADGWSSPDQFWHACYSDIPVLYGSADLGQDPRPGLLRTLGDGGLGQPPLSGALMWLTSAFVPDDGATAPREFFDLSAVMLALFLAVAVAAIVLVKGRRPWDAAHLALSPVLITAGLISYQLLAVLLVSLGVLALARRRSVLGGVLLGLSVTAAPQLAIVVLAVILLVGRLVRGAAPVVASTSVATWFIVRMLLLPGLTGGLVSGWTSWRTAAPGYGSIWLIPELVHDSRPDAVTTTFGRLMNSLFGWIFDFGGLGGTVTAIGSLTLMAVLVVVILRWTLFDGPDPVEGFKPSEFVTARLGPLALALLAAVLVSTKSLPVQASLLLLPFIALAGLRWRDHLIWAVTELVYFVAIWLYIAGETTPTRGLPAPFYLIILASRLLGIAWVGFQGVQAYRARPLPGVIVGDPVERPDVEISSPGLDAGRVLDGPSV